MCFARFCGSSPSSGLVQRANASRFSLAQLLSFGTALNGGPPWVPQAQGPSVFAMVIQEHDRSRKQAQTYTTSSLGFFSFFGEPLLEAVSARRTTIKDVPANLLSFRISSAPTIPQATVTSPLEADNIHFDLKA